MLRIDQPIDRLTSAWKELLNQLQEVSDQMVSERALIVEHVSHIAVLLADGKIPQAKQECHNLSEKLRRHTL